MNELIEETLSSLTGANRIVDLKSSFKLFLEGMKILSTENNSLKKELQEKNIVIASLEGKLSDLTHENVDIVASIEFNAASIKTLEKSVAKVTSDHAVPRQSFEQVQNSLDITDQNARSSTLIMSGKDLPVFQKNENSKSIVIDLLRRHAKLSICPSDVSIAYRIGSKSSGPDRRSILFRLCRRDLVEEIVAASKQMSAPYYLNPSLTPLRSNLFYAVRQLKKKKPAIIQSCRANFRGEVEIYTARSARDADHRNLKKTVIITKKDLEAFCFSVLDLPLDCVKVNWQKSNH